MAANQASQFKRNSQRKEGKSGAQSFGAGIYGGRQKRESKSNAVSALLRVITESRGSGRLRVAKLHEWLAECVTAPRLEPDKAILRLRN